MMRKVVQITDETISEVRYRYEPVEAGCTHVEGSLHLVIDGKRITRSYRLIEVDKVPADTGWRSKYHYAVTLRDRRHIYARDLKHLAKLLTQVQVTMDDVLDIKDLWKGAAWLK